MGFFKLGPVRAFLCRRMIERTKGRTTALPVMEAFHTIQGEGSFSGQAAYFIRLGGCDVGCSWCDVKDSWDATLHPMRSVEDIVAQALKGQARIAVITGGEPLMHDLGPLTAELQKAGFRTHLETSGAHPLSGQWHWICLSPKKFKAPLPGIHEQAHELKVIVVNRHDLEWAAGHATQVLAECRLFLQPEWDRRVEMMPLIVEQIRKDPRWQVSLQIHKYMNIP